MQNATEILKLTKDTHHANQLPVLHDAGDWSAYVNELAELPYGKRRNDGNTWSGAHSWEGAISTARKGDQAMADSAAALVDKMNDQGFLSTGPSCLAPAIVGFMPLVPAYLAGDPMSMLSRSEMQSTTAPVKVVVGIGAGATLTPQQLAKRGAAILAFVLALSASRPVDLYCANLVYSDKAHKPVLITWRLETRPADLPTIAWSLSSVAVHRWFAFTMADHLAGLPRYYDTERAIPYAYGGSEGTMKRQAEIMRLALELGDDDLLIPRPIQDDDPLINKPEQWVKDKLAAYAV